MIAMTKRTTTTDATATLTEDDVAPLLSKLTALEAEIGTVIHGQRDVIRQLLVALLADGHALLEGVPGLAKTLMVRTLSQAVTLPFKRIQFTPDLMPSDIVGTEVLEEDEQGRRRFRFERGPIFANLLLADEINRSPPKTQAALLEAMQERSVTWGGETRSLARPFFVLATQNPIEQSGTYPLPEAQLDRFLMHLRVDYPTEDEEVAMLAATTREHTYEVCARLGGDDLLAAQSLTRQVHISEPLLSYVGRLVRATRPVSSTVPEVADFVAWGAGPRAGQSLILCAKARALLDGRFSVVPDDLRELARPVLRHRLVINFRGQAERIEADRVILAVLDAVAPPASPLT